MLLTRELLAALGVAEANIARYLEALQASTVLHAIDTPLRVAHFLAQVVHESSRMQHVVEGMSYSAERLLQVFPRYFGSLAEAQAYARQPERIGNRVYGGRMGNGDEASGDGYRYRGRGLIQLTGKNNYRAFSQWVGDDVVAHPERVSERYAVQSAVFFWDTHALNPLADVDDTVTITRRINGGLNGFDDRFQLLEKAKAVLARSSERAAEDARADLVVTALPEAMLAPTHRVAATQLNLRSAPRVVPSTWIATLPQGAKAQVVGEGGAPGWVRVRVDLNGILREGLVSARYLSPLPLPQPQTGPQPAVASAGGRAGEGAGRRTADPAAASSATAGSSQERGTTTPAPSGPRESRPRQSDTLPSPLPPAQSVQPVHLRENRADITRRFDGGRAFPLGEPGRPRRTSDDAGERVTQLRAIIDYLDSASPGHLRYKPRGSTTFCNIYAYDLCTLAGAYLPRVWWTDAAIMRMARGETVPVRYGETVRELNANALHDWLEDHGPAFGWVREIDLTTLQAAANAGEVCLIVAKRRDLNQSGHITAVVPEHEDFVARRDAAGGVIRPVESQAGVSNFRYAVNDRAWWLNSRFQSSAFWRHR